MNPFLPNVLPSEPDFEISDLDDLLNRLGESLQLDATRRKLADERYKSVADWIERDETFFKTALINVYAQGSFRIRTTVKPYKQNEFDLDFVVHLDFLTGVNYHPMRVLDELERRLREHETYKHMLERKNRCIRITYANDFHMDIMVGCQESYYEKERIIVPDRKTQDWTPSNPIGYGDWFWSRAMLKPVQYEKLVKAHNSRSMQLRASENLPVEAPYHVKAPLERAVQILKRHRDIYFYNKEELATSSIILTTLAAEAYQGQLSVFETIDGIITFIEQKAASFWGRTEPFQIPNPANPSENFSEKWYEDRRLFDEFIRFVRDTRQIWNSLTTAKSHTLRESLLEQAFGQKRMRRIVSEQRTYQDIQTKAQRLLPLAQAAGVGTLYTTSTVKPTYESTPIQNQPARRSGGKAIPLKTTQIGLGTNYLQRYWIEQAYPGIFTFSIRNGVLVCRGTIKPTEDCQEYAIQLEYVPGAAPQVFILNHSIEPLKEIHFYSNGSLCLFYPPDMAWKHRTSLAAYTIPWIAEWIVCYELWKLTGKWEGAQAPH